MTNTQNSTLSPIDIIFTQVTDIGRGIIALTPNIAIALVLLAVTWGLAKFAAKFSDRLLTSTDMRPSLRELIETVVRLAIWSAGLLITLTVLLPNLTVSSIFAGLGFGAVAVGFAFRDIFENFLAGVLLLLREKMRIGDHIECEGVEGKVTHISLRETHVRRLSNELTVVPNSVLFKNAVEILTDRDQRRFEVIIGVSYDTDLAQASKVIRSAAEGVDMADHEKPIDVLATEFNSSSVDFRVRWWAGSAERDKHESRDAMIHAIKKALNDAGIEIPFPYQTLTFKEPLKIASNS